MIILRGNFLLYACRCKIALLIWIFKLLLWIDYLASLFLVQNIFICYIWIDYHATEIISSWLNHLLIVWISKISVVLNVLSFETLVHNCICLVSYNYLFFVLHYLIVVKNSSYFHSCGIIIALRCVSWTTLKTISQLRAIDATCIHTPYIHLYSTL